MRTPFRTRRNRMGRRVCIGAVPGTIAAMLISEGHFYDRENDMHAFVVEITSVSISRTVLSVFSA